MSDSIVASSSRVCVSALRSSCVRRAFTCRSVALSQQTVKLDCLCTTTIEPHRTPAKA
jgi:hypothetical protein